MKLTQYGYWTRTWSDKIITYLPGHRDPQTLLATDPLIHWTYVTHGTPKYTSHNGKWASIS